MRQALSTHGQVVSISGPSKSGKTVLVEKVVGRDNLIVITGSKINSPDQVWYETLTALKAPDSITSSIERSKSVSGSVSLGGDAGGTLLAKAAASLGLGGSRSSGNSSSRTTERQGLAQVIDEFKDAQSVILIDDFHYMDREVQRKVAEQIKEAARSGVKICVASVPHRADDVVRSNSELRGRVQAIDIKYWFPDQLAQIAELGFPLLNIHLSNSIVESFVNESSGSPQLMQAICLRTCFELHIEETVKQESDIDLPLAQRKSIFKEVSSITDYRSLVTKLHVGPRSRGSARRQYQLDDKTSGDNYRVVLLALAADPPRLTFSASDLAKRVNGVCIDDSPPLASIYRTCDQISKMARELDPERQVIEWSSTSRQLHIIDPYFLFYLRWADLLSMLPNESEG